MKYHDIDGNHGHFSGMVNGDFFPHGHGVMVYDDGIRVEGEWENGRQRIAEAIAGERRGRGRSREATRRSSRRSSRRSMEHRQEHRVMQGTNPDGSGCVNCEDIASPSKGVQIRAATTSSRDLQIQALAAWYRPKRAKRHNEEECSS